MSRTTVRGVGAVVAGALLVAVAAGGVAAAGETMVELDTATDAGDGNLSVGETVSVLVTVSNASAGVGSYDVTVSVNDTGTVLVVGATARGDPVSNTTEVSPESATVSAIGADTADGTDVVVAEVTLRVDGAGTAGVSVAVDALGDESGRSYTVTDTAGTTLTASGEHESGVPRRVFDAVAGSDGTLGRGDVLEMVGAYIGDSPVDGVALDRSEVLKLVAYYIGV